MPEVKNIFTSDDLIASYKKSNAARKVFILFFLGTLRGGILGFAFFFTFLILTKIMVYALSSSVVFNVSLKEIVISAIGFIIFALINFLSILKWFFRIKRK